MSEITKMFEKHLGHLVFDERLYRMLEEFRIMWMNKNEDHIEFLGGSLMGVYPIRFTLSDDEIFYVDLLGADSVKMKSDLDKLKDIHPERRVTSNIFYHTIIFLLKSFLESKEIKEHRKTAITETYLIFAYRALGSLMNHYFKYDLDKNTALLVNERLSKRYKIKQEGSWQKVLEYRALDVTPPDGLHINRLKDYNTVNACLIISDIQGRLRDILKEIWKVLAKVLEEERSHTTKSLATENVDGTMAVAEMLERPDKHVAFLRNNIHKKNVFYRKPLLDLIIDVTNSKVDKGVTETLLYMSETHLKDKKIDDMFEKVTVVSIAYLKRKKVSLGNDLSLVNIIIRLKGFWSRSTIDSKDAQNVKKYLKTATKKGGNVKSDWRVSAIVIILAIYIFTRGIIGSNENV